MESNRSNPHLDVTDILAQIVEIYTYTVHTHVSYMYRVYECSECAVQIQVHIHSQCHTCKAKVSAVFQGFKGSAIKVKIYFLEISSKGAPA